MFIVQEPQTNYMSQQNFKNHTRIVPIWHFVIPITLLALIIMSIISLCHTDMRAYDLHLWLPLIILPIIMLLIWVYARRFALLAQDRAIRAEENFRHFVVTGKPLDRQLRTSQIIALRFASDDEFPSLAQRAVSEKLSPKQIKQAIQNWKQDYRRV